MRWIIYLAGCILRRIHRACFGGMRAPTVPRRWAVETDSRVGAIQAVWLQRTRGTRLRGGIIVSLRRYAAVLAADDQPGGLLLTSGVT
jgi:hypothetical protein